MKRIMSMLLSTALVFTLTACGSGNGDSQSSAVTETTQEMQKESTANDGGNTASEENAKLKLMYWESAYTEPLKQAVAGFQESHPGVTVELEVPAGDYETVLLSRIMSDEAPDLFMYFGSSVFKMAQNGYWGSLDEGSAWVGDLNPSFKQNMTYEGSLYAYPLDCSGEGVFYNKKVFEDNGLKVPETYEDFLTVCDTLKSKGITPVALGAKDNWTSYHAFSSVVASFQTLYDEEFGTKLYDGETTFKDSRYKDAFEVMKELNDRGYFTEGTMGVDLNQAAQSVAAGEAGMLLLSSYAVSVFQNLDPNVEIGYFPFPNKEGESAVVAFVDKAIGYSPSSQNTEICKEFINYIAQPEVLSNMLEQVKSIPCADGIEYDMPAASRELYEAMKDHKVYAFFDSFWPGSCNTVVDKGITAILSGSGDIDQIISDMDSAYQEDKDSVIRPLLVY